MQRHRAPLLLAAVLWAVASAAGQSWPQRSAVPHVVRFSAIAQDAGAHPLTGRVGIQFALYAAETGGEPLWTETQTLQTGADGHYSVLLGAATGLPAQLFTAGQARWLGASVAGQAQQPRVLLVSAPYAVQAKDAATLGGLPPSAFLLAAPPVSAIAQTDAVRDVSPDTPCAKITSDGAATANQAAKFTAPCVIEPSAIFESAGNVGIGTTTPAATLDVKGAATLRSTLTLSAKGPATAAAGASSNPLDLLAASYSSTTDTSTSQHFRWQAEAAANDTSSASGTLNLLYAEGSATPAETGLIVNSQGLLSFAAAQTFPGAGTIAAITPGSGLTGGGTSGAVTIGLTHACASGLLLQWNGSKWVCAAVGLGAITGINAGVGLTGGGSAGNITLTNSGVVAVAPGAGMTSSGGNTPAVGLNTSYTDARYTQLAGGVLSGTLSLPANGLTAAGNQLVSAGGKVGVATATPAAPLEVAGNAKISGAGSGLTFPDGTTQTTAAQSLPLAANPLRAALLKWFPAYQSSASFAVGDDPFQMAFDGANVWVSSDGELCKLLASTGALVTAYSVGSSGGVAFDGANIWVANYGANSVTKVAASNGAVRGVYSVGAGPYGIAFDGANIWVANQNSSNLTKLSASTGAVLGTYSVGSTPAGIVFDGANIWVSNYDSNTVTKLSVSTGVVLGTFNMGARPYGVAFDGANIWVANSGNNNVSKLSAATGALLGEFNVGNGPTGIAFDGPNVWLANSSDNSVSKL